MRGMLRAGSIAGLVVFCSAVLAAIVVPTLTGRVVDEAGILDAATRTALTQKLADLETKSTDQIVVVTLKSLQGTSIEDFGVQLGRAWKVGQKGKNNGALLIVAPAERKVRIEVGYGLEGTLTDAISKLIIENSIIPRFRAGDFPGGVVRGTDDIISAITDNAEWKQRAAKRTDNTDGVIVIVIFVLFFGVFALVLYLIARSRAHSRPRGRRGSRDSGWLASSGASASSSSSWSSGSSDSGFSGGGGDFGGGGSSGSW